MLRFALGLANVPDDKIDELDKAMPGLGRIAAFVKTIEPQLQQSAASQLSQAPIIVAAIDVANGSEALAETLRVTTRRILQTEPRARLACVTVQKTNRIGMDVIVDQAGQNLHVKNLVALKHWARPLNIPEEKITYHVLEAPDAAAAIVDYARINDVDHIVIGSRGSSTLRRYLGSVSSQVVAQADCTVTVVKSAGANAQDEPEKIK